MGSHISLPMYLMSVNNEDFNLLVDAMVASLPELSFRSRPGTELLVVKSWRNTGDMEFQSSGAQLDEIQALREAFESTGVGAERDDYRDFCVRLEWLERDLVSAPICTSQPVHVRDPEWRENRRLVLSGQGVEWESFGYLLGVLLSEIRRLESVSPELVHEFDSKGCLEIGELGMDGLGMVTRTIDSMIAGGQGRSFVNDRGGLNERGLVMELRELL